jgi:hypothetical protein
MKSETINVHGKKFKLAHDVVDLGSLIPQATNPRHGVHLVGGKPLTLSQIKKLHSEDPLILPLLNSVKKNGGILEPLVVEKKVGKNLTREGNRRLFVLYILESQFPGKFNKVPVKFFPDNMDENHRADYIGTIHSKEVGRKHWGSFAEWKFMFDEQKRRKLTDKQMMELKDMDEEKFMIGKASVALMCEYIVTEKTHEITGPWSHIYEIVKAARQAFPKFMKDPKNKEKKALIFKAIKGRKLKNPIQARKILGILKNTQALKILASHGIEQALSYKNDAARPGDSSFGHMEKLRLSITSKPKQFEKRCNGLSDKDEQELIELLSTLSDVLKKTGNKRILKAAGM